MKKPALYPFNYCEVVRIKIPSSSLYGMPIAKIPSDAIMGLPVKEQGYDDKVLVKLLSKKWEDLADFQVFPLL
jgi:hypothetical protein